MMVLSGKLPVSFPRATGTTPAFYNYLKGGRPVDPGMVFDDGTLLFGHQVRVIKISCDGDQESPMPAPSMCSIHLFLYGASATG